MYPPIFARCSANAGVQALLGSGAACRLYLFGQAEKDVTRPYAVWQLVGGAPENYLGETPDADNFTIQIDVYATSAASCRSVAAAIRDAVEPVAYIINWGGESRDPETSNYRYSFDVDWIVSR